MGIAESALWFAVDAALGVWLGAMAFFSFVAAPRVFAVLDEDRAGAVVNDVFPRYYAVGVALGAVALLAAVAAGALSGFGPGLAALLALVALPVGLAGYARWVLIPRMDDAGEDAFERYHRRSVVLNGLAMLSVLLALAVTHI